MAIGPLAVIVDCIIIVALLPAVVLKFTVLAVIAPVVVIVLLAVN